MDNKRAHYGDTKGRGVGDYSAQEKALDASLNAADGPNALNYTVWTRHEHPAQPASAPFGVTSTVVTAANSTLSLAQSEPRMTNIGAAGWRSNPYDFLTDGARAVHAFCRLWPIALVGTRKELAFDIAEAHFKLVVRVTLGESDDDDAEPPASEIFVPLVHYADERAAGGRPPRPTERRGSPNASTINLECVVFVDRDEKEASVDA
ncbi:hypothetical protein B0H14DRAFT_3447961 [Mycena olivaceomarginata]|nr:hypothetical protein B0H14DRAFT_3447961 [Mycena olivaceomarginata]